MKRVLLTGMSATGKSTIVRAHGLGEIGLSTGVDDGYAPARHLYRTLGYAEWPGTLHIDAARRPWDPSGHVYIEVLIDWFTSL